MLFDSLKKKGNIKKMPLMDEKGDDKFSLLQKAYLEFLKDFEELTNYKQKLPDLNKKDHTLMKDKIKIIIQRFPDTIKTIDDLIASLKTTPIKDKALKSKVNEQITIINERLRPKQKELSDLLNSIVETESRLAKRFSNSNIEDIIMCNDKMRSESENERAKMGFRESKLIVQDLVENTEYLRKRQEELEDIRQISSQIRAISDKMVVEVKAQKTALTSAETSVDDAKLNVTKAEFEIEEANKLTSSASRRILFITGMVIILIVLGIIASLMVLQGNGR